MFFSEKFQVSSDLIKDYGAVDISLICDIPLFIDPMLIFNSEKKVYKELHNQIIRYFHFLYKKAEQGLSQKEINAWFNFSEVPNNWLGYALVGNKGLALGRKYAKFLYENISFALNTHGISQSQHIEKAMLLYDGSGKDKISDLTVNLIKGFLCEYTEHFAKEYIQPQFIKIFPVDKAYFNYDTESFVSKEFALPFVYDEKGIPEYILLTPFDILREDEPSINKAKQRLKFFKHIIEDCDGYKNLYVKGKQIAKENDLQRLFRFVWYGTNYKVDAEPNNGRGQADFIISMGQKNQSIVEFKLASNSTLAHVFTQVKIYEAANCTDGSLIAIFCFSESEYLNSEQIVKAAGYGNLIGESIYLIDCRNDNKPSASIA